jgi:hypothetical protein
MSQPISIAAALIDDGSGHIFLVRKRGTGWFMQAGGKIDAGESTLWALLRELEEELHSDRSFEIAAELEEGLWIAVAEARKLPLAPFTRDQVLPLARSWVS